ncbi:hypothetical protein [Rhodopila sp.]|uniref:hypothetical protein n=1 Tax=Rhodopila sp. TaxID=2480087 RepID=UPI003D14B758
MAWLVRHVVDGTRALATAWPWPVAATSAPTDPRMAIKFAMTWISFRSVLSASDRRWCRRPAYTVGERRYVHHIGGGDENVMPTLRSKAARTVAYRRHAGRIE